MKLNLQEKLSEEEIKELNKRVYSALLQVFNEGIAVGTETQGSELFYEAELAAKNKIALIAKVFTDEELWETMPPLDYENIEDLPVVEDELCMKNLNAVNEINEQEFEEAPEWASETKPFK